MSTGVRSPLNLNSNKITSLANGTAASDAAAFGQIPVLDGTAADITPNGLQAAGATGKAADAGHVHANNAFLSLYLAPTGATAETLPRSLAVSTKAPASGTLYCAGIALPKNLVVNNLTFSVGGTAEAGGTHGWYVILDSGLVVRGVTADQTGAAAWGANAVLTLALAAAYTVPSAGLYYVGLCVVATTMPIFAGGGTIAGTGTNASPILCGTSSTGQTTPPTVGTTMTALTANASIANLYAYTS